jgi:hypothetical protein
VSHGRAPEGRRLVLLEISCLAVPEPGARYGYRVVMGEENPIDDNASARDRSAADHHEAGDEVTGSSARDEFVELGPWASAFASLVGVPLWVPTEGRPDR